MLRRYDCGGVAFAVLYCPVSGQSVETLQPFPWLLASSIIFYIQARIERVLQPPMPILTCSYGNPKSTSRWITVS